MSLNIIKVRQPRRTFGKNYKWNKDANLIAFYAFKLDKTKEQREAIAELLDCSLDRLDNRIQHFNSLTLNSKSTTTNPSNLVKSIYTEYKDLDLSSCKEKLKAILKSY
jgi:hypothetical protein